MLKKIWRWFFSEKDKDECEYYVEPRPMIRIVEKPTRTKIKIKRKYDEEDSN